MNDFLSAAVIILFALTVMEHPSFFRYRLLRFVYRSGLLLYARTFKVENPVSKISIPRWKIEHWMSESGFLLPKAEEDGEKRYLLKEYFWRVPLLRGDIHVPVLMRAKISWNNEKNDVVVRGYATWNYFSILALAVFILFTYLKTDGYLCGGVVLFVYLLLCAMVYAYQLPHFQSIGTKVAGYLSSDEKE